jgi:hypothetical protein
MRAQCVFDNRGSNASSSARSKSPGRQPHTGADRRGDERNGEFSSRVPTSLSSAWTWIEPGSRNDRTPKIASVLDDHQEVISAVRSCSYAAISSGAARTMVWM